jgi:hypothetical protein
LAHNSSRVHADVAGVTHHQVQVGELSMHIVEQGEGPLVLLLQDRRSMAEMYKCPVKLLTGVRLG